MLLPSKKRLTLLGLALLVGSTAFFVVSLSGVGAVDVNTDTSLGITIGSFAFFKDTTINMNQYFSHSPNSSTGIDIGTYGASLSPIAASSSGDHRFTVSDMQGASFSIALASSNLTASGVADIPATNIDYTGTDWTGTGQPLTFTGEQGQPLDGLGVTFVERTNNSGPSVFSQEITLRVNVPAAQAPASYTGQLTFTY